MSENRIDYGEATYLLWEERGANSVEIKDIHVHPDFRRLGRGRTMVEALLERLPPPGMLYAITRRTNQKAILFYKSLGFSFLCIIPGLYLEEDETGELMGTDGVMYGRILQ